jgi:Fic family protein
LLEGDIFKTAVLLTVSDKVSDKASSKVEESFLQLIMPYLEKNGKINAQTAAELTSKPAASVRRYLKNLVDAGLLTSSGANKNRIYQLLKK